MHLLSDSGSRASADCVDVVEYRSSEHDGWMFREWRLKAVGVKVDAPLEPWWSEADAPELVIGRIRVKACGRGVDTDLGDVGDRGAHQHYPEPLAEKRRGRHRRVCADAE